MGKVTGGKVLFSGYARPPAGICGVEQTGIIGIVVVVDIASDRIVDAECTLPTEVARRLIAQVLIGESLAEDPGHLIQRISAVFHDNSMRTVIAALRATCCRYANYKGSSPAATAFADLPGEYLDEDATAS